MMANLNRLILIGRFTRDPEVTTTQSGGRLCKFSFCTNGRKKSPNGDYVDDPMFIDCDAWNRGENGRLADLIAEHCKKGSTACLEGKLKLDTWDDKATGTKRSKHTMIVDSIQFLGDRDENGSRPASRAQTDGNRAEHGTQRGDYNRQPAGTSDNEGDIPF
jgi:single-strand DNA-binding protein